jgi:hypothetical protein
MEWFGGNVCVSFAAYLSCTTSWVKRQYFTDVPYFFLKKKLRREPARRNKSVRSVYNLMRIKKIHSIGKKNGFEGEYEEIDSGSRSESNGRSR